MNKVQIELSDSDIESNYQYLSGLVSHIKNELNNNQFEGQPQT